MSGGTVHYFGYGSLVNRATRPADETARPATLRRWRRAWNHRVPESPRRSGCTALSIDPDPGVAGDGAGIAGTLVALPAEALAALDAREAGYARLALPRDAFALPDGVDADEVFVYRTRTRLPADAAHPILASYVDCVMAGYLERFGADGLDAFVATTDGWDGPLADDRAAPRYPRAVRLPAPALARFDAVLRRRAAGLARTARRCDHPRSPARPDR